MISFTANYITSTSIQKIDDKAHPNKDVAIVEFNPTSKDDLAALEDLNYTWDSKILPDLYLSFYDTFLSSGVDCSEKYYALTTQKDNFKKIQPECILGVVQVNDDKVSDSIEIDYLEVNPDEQYGSEFRRYKHVGKALLSSIFKLFRDKQVAKVYALEEAIPFYSALGVRQINEAEMEYDLSNCSNSNINCVV